MLKQMATADTMIFPKKSYAVLVGRICDGGG